MLSASVVWPPRPLPHGRDTLSCTRPPWSALAGVLPRTFVLQDLTRLLESVKALGLVSNAFRRNAAHISGKHATPASFFTISGRGYSRFVTLSFDSILDSEEASSSAPAIRRPTLLTQSRRPARVYHQTGNTAPADFESWCPNPSKVSRSRRGDSEVCSQPLRSLSERSHVQAAFLRSAALAAMASLPKKLAPIRLALPHINPFSGDISKVAFEAVR
jgi:hypothetical protein